MQTLVERLRYQAESFRKQNCPGFLEDEAADRLNAVEAALETALTVLEQIATTPRNRGAKRIASATVAFLRTQLDARHNAKVS